VPQHCSKSGEFRLVISDLCLSDKVGLIPQDLLAAGFITV